MPCVSTEKATTADTGTKKKTRPMGLVCWYDLLSIGVKVIKVGQQ